MIHEWRKGEHVVSTDRSRIDAATVKRFLDLTYWAAGIPLDVVERSLDRAISFGVHHEPSGSLVGVARVITDAATFAYLSDVWIEPGHRGRGLSRFLMESILAHPELQGLRRFMLATKDAHALYARFGFAAMAKPDWWMEIVDPDPYGLNPPPTTPPPPHPPRPPGS